MAKTSGMAITSLVMGILGFIFMWVPIIGFILAVLALIFGIIALSKIKKDAALEGRILAIVGIVLGIVSIIYNVLVIVGLIALFANTDTEILLNTSINRTL